MSDAYVHGYDPEENTRLHDQAHALLDLLHADTSYPPGSRVLEAACGVGAQTVTLVRRSPGAHFTCIDIAEPSLLEARRRTPGTAAFARADVLAAPFPPASFDHAFVCFLLEHLARPVDALVALGRLVRPGGTITVIEGDHGSAYFHPRSDSASAAIQALVTLQEQAGGDSLIGRRLYPLLLDAGLEDVRVSPRMVYADASRPDLVDGFTRRTFTAMVEGVRRPAVDAGIIDAPAFDAGVQALHRTAEPDGVFCYTFFKAVARTAGVPRP